MKGEHLFVPYLFVAAIATIVPYTDVPCQWYTRSVSVTSVNLWIEHTIPFYLKQPSQSTRHH